MNYWRSTKLVFLFAWLIDNFGTMGGSIAKQKRIVQMDEYSFLWMPIELNNEELLVFNKTLVFLTLLQFC